MKNFDFETLKALTIPEGEVIKIERGNEVLWEKVLFKNWARYSINADGTIYNNGLGYKEGYRVRSGGTEAANATSTITGYIPIKGGEFVEIYGVDFFHANSDNAINVSDSSFENLGQIVANYATAGYGIFADEYRAYCFNTVTQKGNGAYRWVAPPADSGIAYIRVTARTTNGAGLIVAVNQEIPV